MGRRHKENQDRVLARTIEWEPSPVYLIAVADGISGCSYGGSVARFLIEKRLQQDTIFDPCGGTLSEQFEQYLSTVAKSFREEFADMEDMLASGATLSAAVMMGDCADCFCVGDSPIYISRQQSNPGFATTRISRPDHDGKDLTDHFGGSAPFKVKHLNLTLNPGDVITITSDGAIHDADILSRSYASIGLNQTFLGEVRDLALRSRFPDDISIAACQLL